MVTLFTPYSTRIRNGFALIIDDSGHRKSGNFTSGVGRQYIGEIGKTDNGIVIVTTHLYDGVRSLPLDVELYQHADSLPLGKEDKDFVKKPDIALKLINQTRERKYRPGIVLRFYRTYCVKTIKIFDLFLAIAKNKLYQT